MKKFYLFIVILSALFTICVLTCKHGYAVDPSFQKPNDPLQGVTEVMHWGTRVVVSTGTCNLCMMTNCGNDYVGSPTYASLPAGTTVYFRIAGTVVSSDPSTQSLNISGDGGSWVIADWNVDYSVKTSSPMGH